MMLLVLVSVLMARKSGLIVAQAVILRVAKTQRAGDAHKKLADAARFALHY
jgi:hypothetical protein